MITINEQPLHEYRSSVEYNGRTIDIIIKSYENKIGVNGNYDNHTRITFESGGVPIAIHDIPAIVEPEKSEEMINEIKSKLSAFKLDV